MSENLFSGNIGWHEQHQLSGLVGLVLWAVLVVVAIVLETSVTAVVLFCDMNFDSLCRCRHSGSVVRQGN